jgi:hypothetical protein
MILLVITLTMIVIIITMKRKYSINDYTDKCTYIDIRMSLHIGVCIYGCLYRHTYIYTYDDH